MTDRSTGKNQLDLSGLYEVLWEEKAEIIEMIEMLEVLRNGWLKYELGMDTLAKIAYMSGNPELRENGLPKCVDDYLAALVKALIAQLNRINELISQAEKGGGDGCTSQSGC